MNLKKSHRTRFLLHPKAPKFEIRLNTNKEPLSISKSPFPENLKRSLLMMSLPQSREYMIEFLMLLSQQRTTKNPKKKEAKAEIIL